MSEPTIKTLKEACLEEEECWDTGAIWKKLEAFEKKHREFVKFPYLMIGTWIDGNCQKDASTMEILTMFIRKEVLGE